MQAERAVPHHANRASSSLSHLWQGDGQRGLRNADGWWTLKWIHAADTADGFRSYSADQHASAPSPLAGGNSDGTTVAEPKKGRRQNGRPQIPASPPRTGERRGTKSTEKTTSELKPT